MTRWHLLGTVLLVGGYLWDRWDRAHPVIGPPRDLGETATRLAAAWWTRREQRLNQVCEARVIARRPRRDEAAVAEREQRLVEMGRRTWREQRERRRA